MAQQADRSDVAQQSQDGISAFQSISRPADWEESDAEVCASLCCSALRSQTGGVLYNHLASSQNADERDVVGCLSPMHEYGLVAFTNTRYLFVWTAMLSCGHKVVLRSSRPQALVHTQTTVRCASSPTIPLITHDTAHLSCPWDIDGSDICRTTT